MVYKIEICGIHEAECELFAQNVRTAVSALNMDAEIVWMVAPISDWRAYVPPILMLNGSVLSAGRVISPEQIQKLFPSVVVPLNA